MVAGCDASKDRSVSSTANSSPKKNSPDPKIAVASDKAEKAENATAAQPSKQASKPKTARRKPRRKTPVSAANPAASSGASPAAAGEELVAAAAPVKRPVTPPAAGDQTQLPPDQLIMPKVLLTEGHAKTCLVKVGDPLPDIQLPDLDGKQQSLDKLLGSKLTVVAFWTSSHPYAVEELADLGPTISARFGARGVHVIAVNERDSPEAARKTLEGLGVKFPNLMDDQGTALGQIATGRLPRTYLIDHQRKILWFDIEYSRSTRRDLLRAIQVSLQAQR